MGQLKHDIEALFKDKDLITSYYLEAIQNFLRENPSENDEYEIEYILSTTVKEEYENEPSLTYPLVTIGEIENIPDDKYHDGTDFVTILAYQFTINCEQTLIHTANENVRIIQYILDKYLKNDIYKCLRRITYTRPYPSIFDKNVRTGNLRYNCNYVSQENTIYRRY